MSKRSSQVLGSSTEAVTTTAKRAKNEAISKEQGTTTYLALANAAKEAAALHGTTASVAVREFRRFMDLKVVLRDKYAVKISPTPLMDAMWHAAVLDTVFYAGLQKELKMTIHHRPSGAGPAEAEARRKRLTNLGNVYRLRYDSEPFGLAKEILATAAAPAVPALPVTVPVTKPTFINVTAKTLFGLTIPFLRVEKGATVLKLKTAITEKEGVPEGEQRIIFGGRQLVDTSLLSECGIGEGAIVDLVVRLRGC